MEKPIRITRKGPPMSTHTFHAEAEATEAAGSPAAGKTPPVPPITVEEVRYYLVTWTDPVTGGPREKDYDSRSEAEAFADALDTVYRQEAAATDVIPSPAPHE